VWQPVSRLLRGVACALRSRPGAFAAGAASFFALSVLLPPALLSLVRKPFDYFAFNAWLPELPHYLLHGEAPLRRKLEFIPNLAIFWFSADSPYGGVDWGFAVTVGDLLRFLFLSLLFGAYFTLLVFLRNRGPAEGSIAEFGRAGGVSGALATVLGISTGGCTVMGCGAPVIPVVGLAFAGLSSGTLVLLAWLSRVATAVVFVAVTGGVAYLAWQAGSRQLNGGGT
jgi:hypothetical protein